jgi:hypothetical protein
MFSSLFLFSINSQYLTANYALSGLIHLLKVYFDELGWSTSKVKLAKKKIIGKIIISTYQVTTLSVRRQFCYFGLADISYMQDQYL